MHIPDNYLSPATCAAMGAAMVPVWAVAVKKVKKEITKEKMPMLGIGAAFSFLIMMLNLPLPGGTTGHAVGGTLLAILTGPYSACISLTTALFIQALLFGDGGILAFGANCFNMAFILPFTGYFIYTFISRRTRIKRGEAAAAAVGSYFGINAAALFAAVEFGIQPLLFRDAAGYPLYNPYPLSVSVPAIMIPHLLIVGFMEAAFTAAVIGFIKKVSPGIVYEETEQKKKAVYGFITTLICLTPLGLLAAGTAWGEWSMDEIGTLGFIPEGMKNGFRFESLMPDYAVAGMPEILGYILSAVAGTAVILILFKMIGHFIRKA